MSTTKEENRKSDREEMIKFVNVFCSTTKKARKENHK